MCYCIIIQCDKDKTTHAQMYLRPELKSVKIDCNGNILEDLSASVQSYPLSAPIITSVKPQNHCEYTGNDVVCNSYLTYECFHSEVCSTICEQKSKKNSVYIDKLGRQHFGTITIIIKVKTITHLRTKKIWDATVWVKLNISATKENTIVA